MKRHQMLGGVMVGAGAALVANALLLGSLFTDGSTEVTMLVLAGLALLFSLASVGFTAMIRPGSPMLSHPAGRHLSKVA